MKGWKLATSLILLAAGMLILLGMIRFVQRVMVSSLALLSESEEIVEAAETPEPSPELDLAAWFDPTPTEEADAGSPESLVDLPVEKTAEELAQENENQQAGKTLWQTPSFDTFWEAQFYIRQCVAEMRENFEFWLCDPQAMEMQEKALRSELVLMSAEARCFFKIEREDGRLHISMTPTYYPGTRIVDAWRRGDLSGLTGEERKTLDLALRIVREEENRSTTRMELEKRLHDRMCLSMCYEAMDNQYEGNGVQRVCSAIGGLLDGQANCQGYADTFYLLASLAGMTVSRQNGRDWMGEGHMWNTILLDGKWYAVDVTGDDIDDEEAGGVNYIYFNLGRDLCERILTWPEQQEIMDVTKYTDGHYYYFAHEEDALCLYGEAFQTIDEMGQHIFEQRRDNGQEVVLTVVLDADLSADDLHDALHQAVADYGGETAWTVWTWSRGGNTYFITRWTKF